MIFINRIYFCKHPQFFQLLNRSVLIEKGKVLIKFLLLIVFIVSFQGIESRFDLTYLKKNKQIILNRQKNAGN
jgi:hypothetical protein